VPRLVPVLLLVVFPVPGGLCTCCARLVLAPVLVLQRVPSNRVVLVLVLPCTIVSQWWGYSCPPHRRPHLVPVAVTRGRQCPCRSCPSPRRGVPGLDTFLDSWGAVYRLLPSLVLPRATAPGRHLSCGRRHPAALVLRATAPGRQEYSRSCRRRAAAGVRVCARYGWRPSSSFLGLPSRPRERLFGESRRRRDTGRRSFVAAVTGSCVVFLRVRGRWAWCGGLCGLAGTPCFQLTCVSAQSAWSPAVCRTISFRCSLV